MAGSGGAVRGGWSCDKVQRLASQYLHREDKGTKQLCEQALQSSPV